MRTAELYRQRALECERLALQKPREDQRLREIAETWRFFAQEADDQAQPNNASTVH